MIFLGKEVHNYGEPFIVAELSCNHMGNINRAFQLIEAAKWAGADAVKIQCYDAEDLTLNNGYVIGGGTPWSGQSLYELYQQATTPLDWMNPLFACAKHCGIPMFSSVYSEKGLALLEELDCPAYKIASYEANDIGFMTKVAETNKPMVISVGTLSDDEINRILRIRSPKIQTPEDSTFILLHCISQYPCELKEIGLQTLKQLQDAVVVPVGFSCHCDNPNAVVLAAGFGAAMIELHLALGDEEAAESPDWAFSFTPNMLKYTIEQAKDVRQAIGHKNHVIETPARAFKRSLYVVQDIKVGELFTEENVKSFRPNLGCAPYLLPNIVGRKAKRDIPANTPMEMEYVE